MPATPRQFEETGTGPARANAIASIHGIRLEVRSLVNESTTVESAVPETRLLANHVQTIESAAIAV